MEYIYCNPPFKIATSAIPVSQETMIVQYTKTTNFLPYLLVNPKDIKSFNFTNPWHIQTQDFGWISLMGNHFLPYKPYRELDFTPKYLTTTEVHTLSNYLSSQKWNNIIHAFHNNKQFLALQNRELECVNEEILASLHQDFLMLRYFMKIASKEKQVIMCFWDP